MKFRIKNFISYINSITYIDDRSLALFRIIAGFLIITEVVLRIQHLNFFYTDYGPNPIELIQQQYSILSLHYLTGDPIIIWISFIIQFILGILLILGFKTKWVLIISFILLVSIDNRNPFITSYADTLFRLLLFWALFLPLERKWSIDKRIGCIRDWTITSRIAGVFILIQMLAMYFTNASHKFYNLESWLNGEAFYTILYYDSVTFFLAEYVRELPYIFIQVSGFYWFFVMIIAPVMLFIKDKPRYILAIGLMLGHIGITVTSRIGLFSFVSIMGLVLFLQSQFWNDCNKVIIKLFDKSTNKTEENQVKINKSMSSVILLIIVLVIGSSMIIATGYNSQYIDEDDAVVYDSSQFVQNSLSHARLDQPTWSFYTGPRFADTTHVIAAETSQGNEIDILRNEKLELTRYRNQSLHEQFESYRHRFYFNSVEVSDVNSHTSTASYLSNYLCQNWEQDGVEIEYITIYTIDSSWSKENIGDYDSYDEEIKIHNIKSCDTDKEPKTVGKPDIDYEIIDVCKE